MSEHVYEKCTRKSCTLECPEELSGRHMQGCEYSACSGCREDTGMDCRYDCLAFCKVCGGMEGSLLPYCPERRLTADEDARNYAMYCEGVGPFAKADSHNCHAVAVACVNYAAHTTSQGAERLRDAVLELAAFVDETTCAICSCRRAGGVVQPANKFVCNVCLLGKVCP